MEKGPAQHGKPSNPDQNGPPWWSVCQPDQGPGKGPQMKTTRTGTSVGPHCPARVSTYSYYIHQR